MKNVYFIRNFKYTGLHRELKVFEVDVAKLKEKLNFELLFLKPKSKLYSIKLLKTKQIQFLKTVSIK